MPPNTSRLVCSAMVAAASLPLSSPAAATCLSVCASRQSTLPPPRRPCLTTPRLRSPHAVCGKHDQSPRLG
jgi:hypothetical protein